MFKSVLVHMLHTLIAFHLVKSKVFTKLKNRLFIMQVKSLHLLVCFHVGVKQPCAKNVFMTYNIR